MRKESSVRALQIIQNMNYLGHTGLRFAESVTGATMSWKRVQDFLTHHKGNPRRDP